MNIKKITLLAPGLLLLALLSGCMMPGGSPALPRSELDALQVELEKIDRTSDAEVKTNLDQLELATEKLPKEEQAKKTRDTFLVAYSYERLGRYEKALEKYEQLTRSPYRALAYFRSGEVSALGLKDTKGATKAYSNAGGRSANGGEILVRELPTAPGHEPIPTLGSAPRGVWRVESLRIAANQRADVYRRTTFSYQAFDAIVALLGKKHAYNYGLAIILIAIIVKVITTPLTVRQFKSMREMQALQPLLTDLQRKFKNDRDALMRAQMKLFKEHKINPMGGCLPMLIQLPFLIWVYQAVWAYSWQFEGKHFIWIANLAEPDKYLLVLYAVSLYFSQKLTTTPTADPQQQQMQRMMAYLFPVMFLVMFQSMPAAFILYWFAQNVLMTAHQYYIMKQSAPPAFAAAASAEPAERKDSKKK